MGLAAMLSALVGLLLVVLSANGRLQPTIAAAFGQASPGPTPLGSGSSNGSSSNSPGGLNSLGGILSQLASGGGGGGGNGWQSDPGQGDYGNGGYGGWGDNAQQAPSAQQSTSRNVASRSWALGAPGRYYYE